MYVFHAWQSSMQLFKPSNLKLFGLVVLKSIKSTYEKYGKYGWPFIAAAVVGSVFVSYNQEKLYLLISSSGAAGNMGQLFVWFAISLLVLLMISYCTFLVALFARTSVDKKDVAYVKKYTKKYFVWYILFHIFYAFFLGSLCVSIFNCCAHLSPSPLPFYMMPALRMFFYVAHIFAILFLLDLKAGLKGLIKSIWFGFKMAFYNMPFTAVAALLIYLIDSTICMSFFSVLLYPLWFCTLACYYIKKVQDQSRLYQGL